MSAVKAIGRARGGRRAAEKQQAEPRGQPKKSQAPKKGALQRTKTAWAQPQPPPLLGGDSKFRQTNMTEFIEKNPVTFPDAQARLDSYWARLGGFEWGGENTETKSLMNDALEQSQKALNESNGGRVSLTQAGNQFVGIAVRAVKDLSTPELLQNATVAGNLRQLKDAVRAYNSNATLPSLQAVDESYVKLLDAAAGAGGAEHLHGNMSHP